jgi:hypothetical protein
MENKLMNTLKVICLTVVALVRHVCLFPKNLVDAMKLKRQQAIKVASNVERLDRIRNPSKYVGK